MSALVDGIRADAVVRGESLHDAVRHHLLTGVIERVARSPAADVLVLRGGMVTRMWIAPGHRPTRDLDYVGDFAFDRDATARHFAAALAVSVDDEVRIDPASLVAESMWIDTGFPGVRLALAIGLGRADQRVTIDVGFGDPLVPAATWLPLPSGARVRACRPETQLAWKLHALAEMGANWRPKDLADLWLITSHVACDPDVLPGALDAAFTSRGFALDLATRVLIAPHWATKTARVRWEAYRGRLRDLPQILDDVRARLSPALADLRSLTDDPP